MSEALNTAVFVGLIVLAGLIGWLGHDLNTRHTEQQTPVQVVAKGYWVTVNPSGSMLPSISARDRVYLDYVHENTSLVVGDVVAYRSSDGLPEHQILHRIVLVVNTSKYSGEELLFVLMGDANAYPDPEPIVRGRVVAKLNRTVYG